MVIIFYLLKKIYKVTQDVNLRWTTNKTGSVRRVNNGKIINGQKIRWMDESADDEDDQTNKSIFPKRTHVRTLNLMNK